MYTRRGVRFSLMFLPLAVFVGLGVLCQPQTIPTTASGTTTAVTNTATPVAIANQNSAPAERAEVVQVNKADTSEVVDGNINEPAPVVDVAGQSMDAERLARIGKIRDALESYNTTNSAYPEKLDVLLQSGYLTAIPQDIDNSDFSYTPIGALPAQFYDLCYNLDVGVGLVTAGYHCANPDGVANP